MSKGKVSAPWNQGKALASLRDFLRCRRHKLEACADCARERELLQFAKGARAKGFRAGLRQAHTLAIVAEANHLLVSKLIAADLAAFIKRNRL